MISGIKSLPLAGAAPFTSLLNGTPALALRCSSPACRSARASSEPPRPAGSLSHGYSSNMALIERGL